MSGNTFAKSDIVDAIYKKTDRNRSEIRHMVDYALELMKKAIKKDAPCW